MEFLSGFYTPQSLINLGVGIAIGYVIATEVHKKLKVEGWQKLLIFWGVFFFWGAAWWLTLFQGVTVPFMWFINGLFLGLASYYYGSKIMEAFREMLNVSGKK